jgi:tRNA (Thr-GGU) A37 N-methylase
VLEIARGNRLRVDHLDAVHGTPIIDLKPVLDV